jgi:hypothetical protein
MLVFDDRYHSDLTIIYRDGEGPQSCGTLWRWTSIQVLNNDRQSIVVKAQSKHSTNATRMHSAGMKMAIGNKKLCAPLVHIDVRTKPFVVHNQTHAADTLSQHSS